MYCYMFHFRLLWLLIMVFGNFPLAYILVKAKMQFEAFQASGALQINSDVAQMPGPHLDKKNICLSEPASLSNKI